MKEQDGEIQYYEVPTFEHLIGNVVNGKIVTEEMLERAKRKCIGDRKRRKDLNITADTNNATILALYVSENDVINAIASAGNLKPRSVDTSVKFDDIRDMELGIELLKGYRDAEKKVIQRRLYELAQDFDLEKSTDKFLAWRVAVCELKIMQLETLIVVNSKEAANIDAVKQLDSLDKQYKVYCESLNVLKRQRDNTKKPKEEFSLISDQLKVLDKSIDELKQDVELEDQEEEKMLNRKKKR